MNILPEMNILLVDDEEDFARTLAQRLELRGYSAEVRSDGESALATLREEQFDLVLLDVMLPGQSGLAVLRRIRETLPDLPVILLTGHTNARDGIEGMKQGARAYINKPVALQELLDLFAEIQKERGRA